MSHRPSRRGRRQASTGFTLLEIAIALAILGIGVVTCLQVFGGSLRLEDRATKQTRAVLHARATMDSLMIGQEIADQNRDFTTAEGFHTRVLVRDAGADEGIDKATFELNDEYSLKYLEVAVDWQDGLGTKNYVLKSLRMALANE